MPKFKKNTSPAMYKSKGPFKMKKSPSKYLGGLTLSPKASTLLGGPSLGGRILGSPWGMRGLGGGMPTPITPYSRGKKR